MRSRSLPLIVIVVTLVAGITMYAVRAMQDVPAEVYLGGVIFQPSSIPSGQSTLRVSVATSPSVPTTGIRAILVVTENQNFGGVSYSITPEQTASVTLVGGGRASIGEFTVTLSSQNTGRGSVVFRVNLVRLENIPQGATVNRGNPSVLDATLSVSPTPTPTPTPAPTPTPIPEDEVACREGQIRLGNRCISPIIIDTQGDGFDLTNAQDGVDFDLDSDGFVDRSAWTAAGSDDAFLFLDGNENGVVDSGIELFGNLTPQPYSSTPNGFVALGMYDGRALGGNNDGVIDSRDEVFSQLRLWIDANHNAVSEPIELNSLPGLGVEAISLKYKESKWRDRHGNLFRYRAKVYDVKHADNGRWAYDVFLRVSTP